MDKSFVEICCLLSKILISLVELSLNVDDYTSMTNTSPTEVIECLDKCEQHKALFERVLQFFVSEDNDISYFRKYSIFVLILNIIQNSNESLSMEDVEIVLEEILRLEKDSQRYIVPSHLEEEDSQKESLSYMDDPYYRILVCDENSEKIKTMLESGRTLLRRVEDEYLDFSTSRSKMINFMTILKQDVDKIDFSLYSNEESDELLN